jgi:eukaryotic-like serine/threonine-protein kinase
MPHPLSRDLCHPIAGQKFTVGRETYVMGGALGDGAVGLVRKATLIRNSSIVAVKLLAPDPKYIDENVFDDVAARFRREGERGLRLRHPHLVATEGYSQNEEASAFEGEGPANPLLVMEFIRGRTLESYIRNLDDEDEGRFRITREKLNIAIQVASAVEDLHQKRLVHRDIKPANIFLRRTEAVEEIPLAKIGDFGVMKWGDFHASLSTGLLTATSQKGLGTLKYMSPEAAIRPKEVTVRSDIYSLGITLFELFSGQVLVSAHHVFEVMNARLTRGTTSSRFRDMGYALAAGDEDIAEMILDMHLRGQSGRPSIEKVRGRLEWEYESRYDSSWQEDLYANASGRKEDEARRRRTRSLKRTPNGAA